MKKLPFNSKDYFLVGVRFSQKEHNVKSWKAVEWERH